MYAFQDQPLCDSTSAESVKKLFQLKNMLDREDPFQLRRQKEQLANIVWFGEFQTVYLVECISLANTDVLGRGFTLPRIYMGGDFNSYPLLLGGLEPAHLVI